MIDFIPLENYQGFYYNVIFIVVLLSILNLNFNNFFDLRNLKKNNFLGLLLVAFLCLIIGFRPISGRYFGDTSTYALDYKIFKNDYYYNISGDPLFYYLMKFSSKIIDVHSFFFICSLLYILPLYFASKKLFKEYWYYSFLMLVLSLSFWSYGVNGVRNGIATSIFLYAISRTNLKIQLLLLLIALGFHKSLILPTIGFLLTLKFNAPRVFTIFWFACIPFSLLIGESFQNLFSSFFQDEKLDKYFYSTSQLSQFSKVGFRWDFVLYSFIGVFSGWYFIVVKKFKDLMYFKIYNTYLFANGIWIIVIRTSFSNRFAYLSWFLLGVLIVYPFLTKEIFRNQKRILGNIMFIYFLITYFLDFILLKDA
jgi:hypothetical protein